MQQVGKSSLDVLWRRPFFTLSGGTFAPRQRWDQLPPRLKSRLPYLSSPPRPTSEFQTSCCLISRWEKHQTHVGDAVFVLLKMKIKKKRMTAASCAFIKKVKPPFQFKENKNEACAQLCTCWWGDHLPGRAKNNKLFESKWDRRWSRRKRETATEHARPYQKWSRVTSMAQIKW